MVGGQFLIHRCSARPPLRASSGHKCTFCSMKPLFPPQLTWDLQLWDVAGRNRIEHVHSQLARFRRDASAYQCKELGQQKGRIPCTQRKKPRFRSRGGGSMGASAAALATLSKSSSPEQKDHDVDEGAAHGDKAKVLRYPGTTVGLGRDVSLANPAPQHIRTACLDPGSPKKYKVGKPGLEQRLDAKPL